MFGSLTFDFKKPTLLKKGVGAVNTYSAIASTAAVDRHKDIVVPKGVMLDSFMKNPVMLNIHQSRQYPVAKVTEVKVTKEAVEIQFQWADTEEGQKLEKLYNSGFMNAFSIGFIPKAYIDLYDMRDENGKLKVSSIDVELPNGEKETIDLSNLKEVPYGIIPKWELLEVSPVSIPANPEALMIRAKDDIIRKYLDSGHNQVAAKMLDRQLSDHINQIQAHLNELLAEAKSENAPKLSFAVQHEVTKLLEDSTWDKSEAQTSLAIWASADKSGDKDSLDWTQYAKGFGWVDLDNADKLLSYKFIHHTVKDGELCQNWIGLTNAMADVLANQKLQDIKDVYAHLVNHYKEFGKEAPEYKEYSEEELAKIKDGVDLLDKDSTDDLSEEGKESDVDVTLDLVKVAMEKRFDAVTSQVAEFEQVVRVRLNILGRMFEELQKELANSNKPDQVVEEPVPDDAKTFAEGLNELASLIGSIRP